MTQSLPLSHRTLRSAVEASSAIHERTLIMTPVLPGPSAIAAYLGLTPAELRASLRSGATLAEVAAARGRSLAGLEAAIDADLDVHLGHAAAGLELAA